MEERPDRWFEFPWRGDEACVVLLRTFLEPSDPGTHLTIRACSEPSGSSNDAEVTRRQLERWLVEHGFVELPGKATGHRQFVRGGLKITVSGHGPQDLTKKHVAMVLRQLAGAGFDKGTVRRELSE